LSKPDFGFDEINLTIGVKGKRQITSNVTPRVADLLEHNKEFKW
jgi:hypothetical protein